MIITHDLLAKADFREKGPHEFVGEASSLGLPPGDFPINLNTDIGNKLPFIRSNSKFSGGDLCYVEYVQANGCILIRIYND